jgi:ubiquinone/menaquinone biosynthesis C-methylase UbiE
MAHNDGRHPPYGPVGGMGGDDWDDWDPTRARSGYTGHVRALRDLDLHRDPAIDLPTPVSRQAPPGGYAGLSPAALAVAARAETSDYLTVTYDPHDPGFAELYDAVVVPQWSAPFGRLLLSMFLTLSRDEGWQVLDVACGTGYPTLDLARHLGQDCDLAGIDVWEEAIQLARRKASEEWLRNVTFLVADLLASGLQERAFDLVTCNLSLQSMPDRAGALGAMWRLLRPQGQLLLTLPLQSAMREFLDTYYLTLRELGLGDYARALTQHIAAHPAVEDTQRLVERAGFEVRRVATGTFTLRFPSSRDFLISPMIQTTFMVGWRELITDVTVRRLVFNEVERRLAVRAQASGGDLFMTVPMLCVSAVRM